MVRWEYVLPVAGAAVGIWLLLVMVRPPPVIPEAGITKIEIV